MDCEALDKDGHEYDKGNAHEEDSPPEFSHPLNNGQKSFLVEKQIFQPDKRTFCVHFSTLEEYIAVTLKVVARGSWTETEAFFEPRNGAGLHEVFGGHAGFVVARPLAGQLA